MDSLKLRPQQPFYFHGSIPASKSLYNRASILQIYGPELEIQGFSRCEDVRLMSQAVANLRVAKSTYDLDCGYAGTVLRFLAFAVGRRPGRHLLRARRRLLARPQTEISDLLGKVGVKVEEGSEGLWISGEGWKNPQKAIQVRRDRSSQFLSGLLLNAWGLPFALDIEWDGEVVSDGYAQMTLRLVREAGMRVEERRTSLHIPAAQKLSVLVLKMEADMSSTFAVAALAAVGGEATFMDFPTTSQQPDSVFVKLLLQMGAQVQWDDKRGQLVVARPPLGHCLRGVEVDLSSSPDLFPILAILCGLARGPSRLYGAPHLVFKESKRIEKTAELLKIMQVPFAVLPDGISLAGRPDFVPAQEVLFDPAEDHRMAMAAAIAAQAGHRICLQHPGVVEKSFPEFWTIFAEAKI